MNNLWSDIPEESPYSDLPDGVGRVAQLPLGVEHRIGHSLPVAGSMITTSVPGGGLPMAWRGVPGTRDIEMAPSLEPYPSTMGQAKRRLNAEMS